MFHKSFTNEYQNMATQIWVFIKKQIEKESKRHNQILNIEYKTLKDINEKISPPSSILIYQKA